MSERWDSETDVALGASHYGRRGVDYLRPLPSFTLSGGVRHGRPDPVALALWVLLVLLGAGVWSLVVWAAVTWWPF